METAIQLGGAIEKERNCPKCKKTFDKPQLVQYYACPHCQNKLEEKNDAGCQHWFGYLNQKEKGASIPQSCVECDKAVECMLNQSYNSTAVKEIKKWY